MEISMIKIPLKQLLPYKLTSSSILLYGALMFYAYKGDCYTTNKTLASDIGISERSVQNCLKELNDKQVIEIKFETLKNNTKIRHIKPLILFDIKVVPNDYKDKADIYAGFEVA